MPAAQDSIDFFAKYKGWVVAKSINCTESTSPQEVSAYLAAVREESADKAFEVLGIDTKVLASYSEKFSKSLPKNDYNALADLYKSLGSQEAEKEIDGAIWSREELKPFAKAYLLRSAAKRLGLNWYLPKESKAFAGKSAQKAGTSVPFSSEGISFMAKYGEWSSIKKLSIDGNTKPEEVAAHLTSIRMAADRKVPQILGVDTDALEAYAAESTGNMRRSLANLQKVIQILCSAQAKMQIDGAVRDPQVREAAIIFLFSRMLQNIKIDLEVNPDTLMDMFPGLKIPKPKGRMPGQKKKKA